jgi:hypothetical protein
MQNCMTCSLGHIAERGMSPIRQPAPLLGENTDEVLCEIFGFALEGVVKLQEQVLFG